ncbi:MAG: hypothetical protein WD993_10105 [Thermoleophilaceae bacterium]
MRTLAAAVQRTPPMLGPRAVRLALSLGLTLLLTGMVFQLAGANPFEAFEALIRGSLGNPLGIEQTIELMTLLTLAGLAVAIPARASLWNIGGEGQIFAGALAAVAVALKVGGIPPALVAVMALVAGIAAGAALGAVAGALRAGPGANEVLTTLMLNFVAILATYYAIGHLFAAAGIRGSTPVISRDAMLPDVPGQTFTSGIALALLAALGAWVLLTRTRLGLKIRATGFSPDAARHNGVRVGGVQVTVMALGGALAGLAGAVVVIGIEGLLARDFSPGYGFIGIAVALLARAHPLWIVPAAGLFSVVTVGGSYLEAVVGLSASVALVIEGVLLLLLLAFWVFPPERGVSGGR